MIKPNFFCDENITRKIVKAIKEKGFEVTGIRDLNLFGLSNGELMEYLKGMTLVTFDKDFLRQGINNDEGIIVIEHIPNRNEFTVPLIEKFLDLLKNEKIKLQNQTILLNSEFFNRY